MGGFFLQLAVMFFNLVRITENISLENSGL